MAENGSFGVVAIRFKKIFIGLLLFFALAAELNLHSLYATGKAFLASARVLTQQRNEAFLSSVLFPSCCKWLA